MTTNDVSDTRISDERLWELTWQNVMPTEFGSIVAELLAARTQSPAEWVVSDLAALANELSWDKKTRHIADRINAALHAASIPPPERSKEETGVRVKPLVWRVPTDHPKDPDIDDNALCADGIGGVYAISKKQKVGPERLLWMADDPFDWKGYGSIPEAKAAAQADYEQRILSALETPPLHKEEVAVYFAEGNTVRKRVGSAFGEGDVLFCTPSAWFPANEVADLLNAAPAPVPVTITPDDGARDALLAEVISLIEDDMYGPGEAEDVPERLAFNRACRRQINRITSRLVVSPKLTAALSKPGEQG